MLTPGQSWTAVVGDPPGLPRSWGVGVRAGFEFKLLGPLEVSAGGYTVPIPAAKQRVVLASLLVDTGRVVTIDQLITQLWDNPIPVGARATLRTYVMRLRQALDTTAATGPIITCAEGYRIELSGHDLDLHRFEALIEQAKLATAQGRSDRASVLLSDALGLWRGEPLSNVPSEVLHREVRPRLDERWLLVRELRIDAALAVGRHQEMIAELGELTTRHPLRERFWAHFNTCHPNNWKAPTLMLAQTCSRLELFCMRCVPEPRRFVARPPA